ncbi:O-antigen ligase family protein [Pseudomonas sp. SA3-5]|uniref:O-antigen ligase family protein n=1 Tax=Pseudomonas aestuarii TaxID=3018340 RepID=A0ABT4XK68_9PSED|nr:O-antigen ligase family protein [Pseudomonas aestuarii]MDA7088498.1 O-antigen ligase family protein [Pseudomonas aestuarii]
MLFSQRLIAPMAGLPKAWLFILGLGLFVQVSGLLFNSDGSRYATQTYLLLFVPTLVLFLWRRLAVDTWRQTPGLILLCLLAWVLLTGSVNAGSSHGPAYWLKIDALILLYVFAVASLARHERAFTWLLVAVVVTAAVFAWLTLYYQFGVLEKLPEYRAVRLQELGWRGLADLDNAIIAGLYYGVFAVLLTYLYVGLKVRGWQAGLLVAGMLGLLAYVLFTFSRGAWLSTAAGCLVMLLLFPNIKSRTLIGLGCALVFVSIYLFWPELQHEQKIGVNGRLPIWANWAERLPEFWLMGAGAGADLVFQLPNSGASYKHAHSLYLQLWYQYGIVGISLFALLLLSLLWKGWACRAQPLARVGLALLVFAMVAMVSDVYAIFHRLSPYWVLVWFPVGILLGVRHPQAKQTA